MLRLKARVLLPVFALLAAAALSGACAGGGGGPSTPSEQRDEASPMARPADATPAPSNTATPAAPAPAASPTAARPAVNTLEIAALPTLKFDKAELAATAETPIVLTFDNRDSGIPHNWALYTDGSASVAVVGQNEKICTAPCTTEVSFGPLAPGSYFFRCDVHPIQMTGQLSVG